MRVVANNYNGELNIEIMGRLDTVTASEFRAEIMKNDFSSVEKMVLDFSGLDYISSAGLRELLSLKKRMGKRPFRIDHVSGQIEEIFKVTGFSTLFEYTTDKVQADYKQMSFKEFIDYKASTFPDKVVLKADGISYTWDDIDRCAQVIAVDLYGLGVRKGTHVAICATNSANWIFTFYALQKLGALVCLLNFNLGAVEIRRLASAGDVTHLCYSKLPQMDDEETFLNEIKEDGCPIVQTFNIDKSISFYDRLWECDPTDRSYEARVETDDACTMVYTSGSTGKPKGVLLSAYNILNASCSNVASLRLTADDKACVMLPFFHIFGLVAGIFANAVADSEMILPDSLRTGVLLNTIYEEKCTVFHSVPTMLIAILNNKEFRPELLGSLRSTILSGALANEAQVRELMDTLPNNHFATSYGLSEMAPVSITDYDDTREHIEKTIGKPVADIDIRIYDTEQKVECPVNVTGEIQVRGYNLMSCYYKAELEQQSIDEDGWLHTGDLGFIDDDGYIHFAGRLKDIIVRGGENVYPREVAEVIAEEDEISDVVVAGIPDPFWGETVAAALVLKAGSTFDEESLKARLARKLAKYKLPTNYCVYDAFPSLPNGKVDMVRLKQEMRDRFAPKE